MKKLIIVFFLTTIVTIGQKVYKVEPGSKGNVIILEIENASNEQTISGITVNLTKQISSLHFTKTEQKIEHLSKNVEAEFEFDVERDVSTNRIDTLKFIVTGNNGILEEKVILIGYTIPTEFKLSQNFPNPFNPATKIEYQLPKDGRVIIKVFNVLGQEVRTLVDEIKEAGYYNIEFNSFGLSSGVYFYSLSTENYQSIKKMVLLK
ncbi:MAG: T9SS type A sorting domain-containing protein [Ignavibacteria bacterium]|nr:T9SS type A sorting domain-containing protein [Ignavibacteria bacterium]